MEEIVEAILNFFGKYGLDIVLIIILLIMSGFFSGSETALYSIDRLRKHKLSLQKGKRYKHTKLLLSKPNELLVTILFGNMIVNIFLSTIVDKVLLNANEVIAIGISTFIILIFGEVLPKFISISNSWSIALKVSKYIYYFSILITPFRVVLNKLSEQIANLIIGNKGKNSDKTGNEVEKDLEVILDMAVSDNVIPKDEAHLIENVIQFAELDVRNVMTPRINIFALPIDISFTKLLFEAKRNKFSKIPVYNDNLDDIVGIIYLKDLIPYYRMESSEKKNINIRSFIKDVYFVPERKPLKALLQDFIKLKIGVAVIIDEYGGTEGLITLNDIIEQILGKFSDQSDDENTRLVSKVSENKFLVLGECTIKDFNKYTDIDINDDDSETIAGYVLKKFDKIPEEGEIILDGDNAYFVKNVNQNKIEQILVTKNNDDTIS